MPLSPNDKLGPYVLISPLGEGGMGEVWKARDIRLDRTVALKVSKAAFSERFEREARAVAALNHPNICTLHDVGPNYLVMEFVEGAPLKGPVPIEKAVEYAGQILEAVDAAHRKGITHRDLKPANILVTRQGIKLLDFGLARKSAPVKEDSVTLTQALTSEGAIVGTLQYMAPEQLQGKDADARSDLFSFGCVLYELLTGKRAFEGESKASIIALILEREPAPLTAPPPLERVVRRCLAKDPEQRFQNARDLKIALTWAMEQSALADRRGGLSYWKWIAAAALVIGLLLGGWAVARFRQSPAENHALRLQISPPGGGQFIFGNNIGGISVSPDGRTAAYVASDSGKSGLWIRSLDGAEARLVAGTQGATDPFWSPDSKSVAFFCKSKLQRIDRTGGDPLVICDVEQLVRGGAWSGDGRILFAQQSCLFQVVASGGMPSPLTTPDAPPGEAHQWPQVLPGGRFLYFVQSERPGSTGVYVSSFAKPRERVRVMPSETNALYAPGGDGRSYLLWVRGGTLLAQEFDPSALKLAGETYPLASSVAAVVSMAKMDVGSSNVGVLLYGASGTMSQFTWLDRSGRVLGAASEQGEYSTFRLSPDGRRLVAARDRAGGPGATDLWLLETGRGVAGRFTINPGLNTFPVWSPDGRTVVFASGAPLNLVRKESSGAGNEDRITQSPNPQYANDWSRNGRLLLYHEFTPDTARDLLVLPVTSEGKPAPGATPKYYLRTPFNELYGRFSPELSPRWVAYQSDVSGRYEIYIQAFPEPRGKFQVSIGGGKYPQWGVGARELFYVSPDNKLIEVSLKLAVDSVEPSAPRELFALSAVDNNLSPYEAAPDGQRFLVRAAVRQAGAPLRVIVNWPALLKKVAAQ